MSVIGLPTNNGLSILTTNLKEKVKKIALYGTTSSTQTVPFNEDSTYASLSPYLIGEFDVVRAYYDENGALTFECPLPHSFENTSWVGACGLIHVENSVKTLVAVSSTPRFQKVSGLGGTIYFKVPVLGQAGSPIFGEMSYISADEFNQKINELFGNVDYAVALAGGAVRDHNDTLEKRIQTGETTIYNRGVISGITATKSTTSLRRLDIAAGRIFMYGRIIPVGELLNATTVPQNTTNDVKYTYVYMYINSGGVIQVSCTNFGELPPADSLTLYKVTVPANNTEATDPYLTNCSLTDLRRIEPNYPQYVTTQPQAAIALAYSYPDNVYYVDVEPVANCDISINNKQNNGFTISVNTVLDPIIIKYKTYRR